MATLKLTNNPACPLNESPSEKEGKFRFPYFDEAQLKAPSMKAPPKRKGNRSTSPLKPSNSSSLNESPSEKEGKFPSG